MVDDLVSFTDFLDGQILSMPIILIVTGICVFLVALLGCYGSIKGSYGVLMTFGICLLILFVVQFGIGIAAAVYKEDFREYINETLTASMLKFQESNTDQLAWKTLQTKLECCGVNGPADWKAIKPYVLTNGCCHATRPGAEPPTIEQCRVAQVSDIYVYQTGCLDGLSMMVDRESNKLVIFGFGIAIFEIVGIILACWLAQIVKDN